MKKTIVELKGYELIPDMAAVFQKQKEKDLDILSVMCVLMKQGKFQPFLKSQTYQKMNVIFDSTDSFGNPAHAAHCAADIFM